MSDYIATGADLTSVADAIRTKGGTSAQLAFPADFVQAIEDIETGGGSVQAPYKVVSGRLTVASAVTNISIPVGDSGITTVLGWFFICDDYSTPVASYAEYKRVVVRAAGVVPTRLFTGATDVGTITEINANGNLERWSNKNMTISSGKFIISTGVTGGVNPNVPLNYIIYGV